MKPLLTFSNDNEIIFFLDSLSLTEIKEYTKYTPIDIKHYAEIQKHWIEVEIYYLAQKLGREPSDEELIGDFEETHNPERYRAFYVLKFPEKIKIPNEKMLQSEENIKSEESTDQEAP